MKRWSWLCLRIYLQCRLNVPRIVLDCSWWAIHCLRSIIELLHRLVWTNVTLFPRTFLTICQPNRIIVVIVFCAIDKTVVHGNQILQYLLILLQSCGIQSQASFLYKVVVAIKLSILVWSAWTYRAKTQSKLLLPHFVSLAIIYLYRRWHTCLLCTRAHFVLVTMRLNQRLRVNLWPHLLELL